MIGVLIVDDAPLAREGIRLRLQDEANIEVVGEAADGPTAVATAHALSTRSDLSRCADARARRLPGLEQLGDISLPAVIMVTAFESYAIKAFGSKALDYMLKPIDGRRFRNALDRARPPCRMQTNSRGCTSGSPIAERAARVPPRRRRRPPLSRSS